MFEINDVVKLNLNACCYTAEERSCMDELKSTVTELRDGFVIGIDNRLNKAEVVFDELPYTLSVSIDFLKKVGRIVPYAINAKIERYMPGKCIKIGNKPRLITHISLEGYMTYRLELVFTPRIYIDNGAWVMPSIYHDVLWPDDIDESPDEKGKESMGYNATQIILDEFDGGSSMTNDIQTAIRNGSTKFQMETKLLEESLKKALELDISPNPIQKVIFNAPATIVFWKDGSKTVVKAQGDEYDPEKGLAMAISRHYLCDVCGLERYDGIFNRYLPKDKN